MVRAQGRARSSNKACFLCCVSSQLQHVAPSRVGRIICCSVQAQEACHVAPSRVGRRFCGSMQAQEAPSRVGWLSCGGVQAQEACHEGSLAVARGLSSPEERGILLC